MTTTPTGRILLLNGPSSSGKSSIGRALLPLLDDPWFFIPVDMFSGMRSTVHRRELNQPQIKEMLHRTRAGYHRSVAGLAATGNDVIMDYPLTEPWRLTDLLEVLEPYDVTLIDVRCDPDELDRRESERGNRPPGLARSQTTVYDHADPDLVVDTTAKGAEECAAHIVEVLPGIETPKAFVRLRSRA